MTPLSAATSPLSSLKLRTYATQKTMQRTL